MRFILLDRDFNKFLVVMIMTLAGCGKAPERPLTVPTDAVYWKSGNLPLAGSTGLWMVCDDQNAGLMCKVWDQNGRLYQHGEYRLYAEAEGCAPTFLTTRFRYQGGYLYPIDVLDSRGATAYGSIKHNEDLQEAIFRVANHRFGFELSNFEVIAQGENDNGTYRASTVDRSIVVSGRFWCAEVFSVQRSTDANDALQKSTEVDR